MCLLAGLAVAVGEGVDPETALRRLSRLPPAPERMEVLALSNGATAILDTFKGSVESFHAALSALGEVPGARRVAVLGEVESLRGRRGPTYRDLGRRTARAADVLFTVSINATRLSSGARSAGMDPGQIIKSGHHARDALDDLRNVLRPGDAVLFKARGSQHLGRLAFALAGRKVRCWVDPCKVRYVGCAQCPMLGRGWEGLPLLF
jgi:UDP-N-acetylmuramoyl-tripeptide--D-alanyl-D-alanine ligase